MLVGKVLIGVGLLVAGVGVVVSLGFPLGRLPGDLVFRRDGATVYIPITSCVLISVVLSFVVSFWRR
ncbi:MAG TPA: DUF2905 domain-containing protein [Acidobacteria bacterium]|nr:DUF2905 domain-containing protein [Acidobacteriota bacterium]